MQTPNIVVVNKTKSGINLSVNGKRVTDDATSSAVRQMIDDGTLKLVKGTGLSMVYRPVQGAAKPVSTQKSFVQCFWDGEPVVIDGHTIWKDAQGAYYSQVGKGYEPMHKTYLKAWVQAQDKKQADEHVVPLHTQEVCSF